MERATTEDTSITVRRLRPADLDAVIAIDGKITGRRRAEYFELKLEHALSRTGIEVSLGAEIDGSLVGFLLCWLYYGEFGEPEPVAVLDTLGVHPAFAGQGVGRALLEQLATNLRGLQVSRLETQVGWDDQALLGFFHHQGFRPAPRYCLELTLAAHA